MIGIHAIGKAHCGGFHVGFLSPAYHCTCNGLSISSAWTEDEYLLGSTDANPLKNTKKMKWYVLNFGYNISVWTIEFYVSYPKTWNWTWHHTTLSENSI